MSQDGRGAARRRLVLVAAAAVLFVGGPALAQGWWPWNNDPDDRPPVPREPVYRTPAQGGQPYPPAQPYSPAQPGTPGQPGSAGQPGQAWGSGGRNNICLELERRLVQEGQRGSESRNLIPMVENELRQVEQQNRVAQQQLERSDCYEYFLFSKTLRRTRKCVDLSGQVEATRRRLGDLEAQLQQLSASAGRSYQDDIIRELARNNCGAGYQQQARQRDSAPSSFWDDGESGGARGPQGNYGNLGYATYKTVCVRLCDGYYFPISFSTLPNHFEQDAEACQSKCAAPSELYYHQNPGAGMDQAVAARTNEPYAQLKTAFRYRKEYVQGCSCKMAEYVPEAGAPQPAQQGAAEPSPGGDPSAASAGGPAMSAWPGAGERSSTQRQAGDTTELPWSRPR